MRRGARDDRVHGVERSTSSGLRLRTTTTRSAGRTRWTRRTSGRSRSPRTGAVRGTAQSYAGPTDSKRCGEIRSQFHHVIDFAPTVLDAAGLPVPPVRRRGRAAADRGSEHALRVRRRLTRLGSSRDAVLRDVLQPRHLPRGLGGGDAALHSVGHGSEPARRSKTTSGSSTTRAATGARPATLRRDQPEKLDDLQQRFLEEARKYGVLPLDDRRVERFDPDLAGRPALIKGNSQILFSGMGRLTENVAAEHQEQVALGDGRGRGAGGRSGGRDVRAGRRRSAAGVCTSRTASSDVLLQPVRPAAVQDRRRRLRSRLGRTRCAWSSPMTAAASRRAGRSSLYVDGEQVGQGRVEATHADGVLRGRDRRCRAGHRLAGLATITRAQRASSRAPSTGFRSTSTRRPRISTI